MFYFINPGKAGARSRGKKRVTKRTVDKPKRGAQIRVVLTNPYRSASDPARSRQPKRSVMARRRKARKTSVAPVRRRRRRRSTLRRNPPVVARRRRRRSAVVFGGARRKVSGRRRRSYRRNPGLNVNGIVGSITQGLKDGAAVVAGQVAARKIRGAITGMLPAATQAKVTTGAGYVGLTLGGAIAVSVLAAKVAPKFARFVTAGAMAEAINAGLAQTPVAPYLGAFPRRISNRVAAWPNRATLPAAGMGAWPLRSVGLPVAVGN